MATTAPTSAVGALLSSALLDDYDTFRARAGEWERLADQEGAHRSAEAAADRDRRAQLTPVGDEYPIEGGFRCRWPGCGLPRVQIDHPTEWSDLGCTEPCNGGLFCGFHSRLKSSGYRARRDEDGGWHLYRPDGTEISAA